MGQRLTVSSELKAVAGGAAKASLNRARELLAVDPKPGDLAMDRLKTEPTPVEKVGDDLWLGVKGQSNREIAGSPRKLFR